MGEKNFGAMWRLSKEERDAMDINTYMKIRMQEKEKLRKRAYEHMDSIGYEITRDVRVTEKKDVEMSCGEHKQIYALVLTATVRGIPL